MKNIATIFKHSRGFVNESKIFYIVLRFIPQYVWVCGTHVQKWKEFGFKFLWKAKFSCKLGLGSLNHLYLLWLWGFTQTIFEFLSTISSDIRGNISHLSVLILKFLYTFTKHIKTGQYDLCVLITKSIQNLLGIL